MSGKGSAPRDQTPGPDGKTPSKRYADNWDMAFGGATERDRQANRWRVRSVASERGRLLLSCSLGTAQGGCVPGRWYWFVYRRESPSWGAWDRVVAQGDEATLDEAQAAAEKAVVILSAPSAAQGTSRTPR